MTLNKQQCLYLICAFVIGFVTNRLVNHQDIITGDVIEGSDDSTGVIIIIICVVILYGILFAGR